jgi:hypothetical protein
VRMSLGEAQGDRDCRLQGQARFFQRIMDVKMAIRAPVASR